ncbi:S41 family peptidase [Pseudoalteromonas sp. BDTF-M6]|uniref:S41 family peptidase n=1 Tax=Pseudoalteromonas sp. BDTF-M6 TaxID=2796132 RepID=UPI002016597A|nr:S41 family peptidase [Pseudoalteromonas sp. BDTF-M6]
MTTQLIKPLLISALSASLLACGGDGSFNGSDDSTSSGWTQGVFAPSSQFKGQCNALDEKNWLRSWSNETYLWYDEITDRDPASIVGVIDYFNTLKTNATTASGAAKDNFHFSLPTDEYQKMQESGAVMGYGFNFKLLRSAPPREVVVSYTEPDTPASAAGVRRGWEIVAVNGVDMINSNDVDALNSALFPSTKGVQTDFTFKLVGSNEERNITLTTGEFIQDPVMNVSTIATNTGNVGYVQFNDHNAPAERQLYDAFNQLAGSNISDLVIDMRYNGGGYLAMAAQLGYMVAGAENTSGLIFEKTIFNDKYPTTNPVTGRPLTPYPFIDEYIAFDPDSGISEGTKLPSLNLERVFVLSSSNTCSASEALINGLRGIPAARGFEVILIGGNTCGKPYGFYPTDNCDTTFFTIQFTGVNHAGFGEYSDGFAPQNTPNAELAPVYVQGCAVADDFTHLLGDKNEAMLAAALSYRTSGVCPAPTTAAGLKGYAVQSSASEAGVSLSDNRWQTQLKNNRVVTPLPKELN